jgi:hypothetical protein
MKDATMQRFESLRVFHVALVGKFIDRGATWILCNLDDIIYQVFCA